MADSGAGEVRTLRLRLLKSRMCCALPRQKLSDGDLEAHSRVKKERDRKFASSDAVSSFERLRSTLRPRRIEHVRAASHGDRIENADYQYGKRRRRQIDGRIRFLTKRIEAAEVVDSEAPRAGQAATRAFFGATVR
jgi:hypothetical protein